MQGLASRGAPCAIFRGAIFKGVIFRGAALWAGLGGASAGAADFFVSDAGASYAAAQPVQTAPREGAGPAGQLRNAAGSVPQIGWQTLARSIEDRVVEYAQFGQGELQTLVIAPLAGNELEGVEIVERLANHLAHFPRSLTNATVTIVRDPNPDGRFRHLAGNARGVMLDQNFATRHWRRTPSGERWLSGREPDSEPETRALIDLLTDLKPHRILILGSERRPPTLTYAGAAEALAGLFAKEAQVRPLALNSADAPGSLVAYAGHDRDIPTLVFRVTNKSSAEQNWLRYKRAILAFLDQSSGANPAQRETNGAASEGTATEETASDALQEPQRLATPATTIALQSKSPDNESPHADAPEPGQRVLSAAELEKGAPLVPVGRPPVSSAPAASAAPPVPAVTAPVPPAAAALQRPPQNLSQATIGPPGSIYMMPQRLAPAVQPSRMGSPRPSAATAPVPPAAMPKYYPATNPPAAPAGLAAPAAVSTMNETPSRLERLPKVESPPPVRNLRQDPIPFYPDTGY